MGGIVIKPSDPLIWLPIYYLQPLEIVAMAMAMGEKKWAKCEEAGKKRNHNHVKAVAYGAEVRASLRKPEDLGDMRPPAEWLAEAKINHDSMERARQAVFDE